MQRFILLLLLFFQLSLYAIHPIQLSVQLSGPYTPFLFEYAGAYSSKIGLTMVVTDNSINNYPVRLEVMIKDMSGTIIAQTTANPIVTPIFINAGSMEYLDGATLAEYFLARNLSFTGLDRNYFLQNNRLPDGVYQFGFRLVDTRRREVILSNTVWTMPAPFILNQPPELYAPANTTELQPLLNSNIRFEWMPKHIGSQNANFTTTYRMELFPLRVDGINPEQYVRSVEPEYTATSNSRSIIVDKSAFNFETGMSYAWRVQATTNQEVSLFMNDGYSTVFVFNYGNPCPVPEHIDIEATDTIGAIVTWDDNPLHTSYLVEYSAGWINPKVWHPVTGSETQVRLYMGMEEKKSYSCRVKAACGNKQSEYSREYLFTTKSIERTTPDFECGATKNATDTSKSDVLITNLRIGSVIYDGDFPVEITKISKDGNKFTGEGLMTIPMLANAKVRMTFSNITVNEDKEVLSGRFISVYDPNSKMILNDASKYFVAGNDVGEVITGEDSAAITLNYVLSSTSNITITNNGNSSIVNVGSDSYSVEGPKEGGTTIVDSQGNLYKVQENGTTSKVGTSGGAFNNESYSANYSQWNTPDGEISASFSNADALWAFDQYDASYAASSAITGEYEKFGDTYVANKLIPEGKWGTLKVTLSKTTDINIDSVVFKTPNGTEYEATCKDKECTLTVVGGRAGDAQEVYALYPKADSSYRSFGKIKVVTYAFIEKSVIVVPVGDEPELSESTKEGVRKLYLPYAVTISLDVADTFAITSWDTDNDGLDADSSGMFSVYSPEMKSLISLYKNQHTISEQSMYLFMLNKINGTRGDLLGDMPVGYQFGFIKSGSGTVAKKTIAHELGHGMLQLEHTFDEITKSTTTNLMDYKTDGLTLVKHQWDAIHDPQTLVFKALQGDEEGDLSVFKSKLSLVYLNDSCLKMNQTLYFLPILNSEIILKAKKYNEDKLEDINVDWSYVNKNNVSNISINANDDFFGDKDKIQIDVVNKVVFGDDSTFTIYIEKIKIDPNYIIDSILIGLKNLKYEFDSISKEITEFEDENIDNITLKNNLKYITYGMSDFFETKSDEEYTEIDYLLSRMFNLDLIMKETDNFNEIVHEIEIILSETISHEQFSQNIINELELQNPLSAIEELKEKYNESIRAITLLKLRERLTNK